MQLLRIGIAPALVRGYASCHVPGRTDNVLPSPTPEAPKGRCYRLKDVLLDHAYVSLERPFLLRYRIRVWASGMKSSRHGVRVRSLDDLPGMQGLGWWRHRRRRLVWSTHRQPDFIGLRRVHALQYGLGFWVSGVDPPVSDRPENLPVVGRECAVGPRASWEHR